MSSRRGRDVVCEQCGCTFYLRKAYERKGGGRFCTMECRRAWFAENGVNYPKIGKRAVHRMVAAQKLGRPLKRGEVVHHVDGNKKNFSPDNLEVFSSHSEHMRHEAATNEHVGFTHDQAVIAGRLSGAARRKK